MENAKFYIAAKGFIFYGDRFLILKKYKYNEDGKWELPGGRLQAGETPRIALEREVWEETGLKISVKKLLSTWSHRIDAIEELVGLNFLCKTDTDFVSLSKEHTDYRWITVSEVNQYAFYQGVIEELSLLENSNSPKMQLPEEIKVAEQQRDKAAVIEEFKRVKKWKEAGIASSMISILFIFLLGSRFYFIGILGLIIGMSFTFYASSKYKCPTCSKKLDSRTEETFCPHCGVQLKELVKGEE